MFGRRILPLSALAAAAGIWPAAAQAGKPGPPVDFTREIRPILSDNCFACHGPDEKKRMVNLRLDSKEGAFPDRGGYHAIVPGDSSRSRLYQKISSSDPVKRMPPPGSGRVLTAQQIDLLRRWIDQGARWDTHWSFVPPRRPELPKVSNAAWLRNAIDHFVLARLEREGLKPSPEAAKATLLRRATLDLTGLPPSPAELDAFLADKSPHAYEKAVDRLLASSRYGERMAMQWLDLARYADTHGYHIDSHRDMWPWRDWVMTAFNRNLPFDQFTIEQLAGDLLPKPTRDQRIATGFNRNHMINFEGGAIPEEYQNEYVVDRVETTAAVWMGLTIGCARCHDHKYDPIKQKEFYELYAFFNTIPEKGLDGRTGNAAPEIPLATAGQQVELDRLKQQIAAAEKALPEKEIAAAQSGWEKTALAGLPEPTRKGLITHYELDGHVADTSGAYRHGATLAGALGYGTGRVGSSAIFNGEAHAELPGATLDFTKPFSLALWMAPTATIEMAVLHQLDGSRNGPGFEMFLEETIPLPDLQRGAPLHIRLIRCWPDQVLHLRTRHRLVGGRSLENSWHQLTITYDGSAKASGLRLYIDGKLAEVVLDQDSLPGPFRVSRPIEVGNKKLAPPFKGQLDDLRLYDRILDAAEIEPLAVHLPIRSILLAPAAKRSRDQRDRLRDYFLARAAPEPLRQRHAALAALKAERTALEKTIPTVMVMQEMEKPRDTVILARGDYRNRGEKVSPDVPAVLSPFPKDALRNRLGLARWLVDPSHPLTARVTLNHFWQMYFGAGLVKTSEDFGLQGEAPTHPELLDWLATEFIRTGWDVKAMQRLIVTSATYRQSSRLTPELREKDPQNRLLARGPRFRLQAEMIRDSALHSAGLLQEKIGGPGVNPYQPKGVWEAIAYGDIYSSQIYEPGRGPDLYRRSMYTFWKRTAPPAALATFDAPDREKCVIRRARTNTPLQALVLMNDPTYVEAARALAQRAIAEAGPDPDRRIRAAYRLVLARNPAPQEMRLLRDLARRQLLAFRNDLPAAARLLAVGDSRPNPALDPAELAAWTTVASTILNLDEAITKE